MEDKYKRVEDIINKRKQKGGTLPPSGYKGVSSDMRPNRKPFRANFNFSANGKKINIGLGYYNTPEEAYIARLKFIDSLK